MPVSRNLSLPSSIEARKFKKRPVGFHDLQHCVSMPNDNSSLNSNSNNNSNNDKEKQSSEMQFHSTTPNSEQRFPVAPSAQAAPAAPATSTSCSSGSRGTLSQPCLSVSNVRATSIFPHLFLGSQNDVSDQEIMKGNKISNVLNVSCTCARPQNIDDDHFRRISVRDNYQEKISPHLDEAVAFIESVRAKNERVLVHCLAGVSRSATVAIAYVMYYLRLSSEDAYRFVKEKRPTISPNFNFLGQLIDFEKMLRDRGHMTKPRSASATKLAEKITEAPKQPPSIKVSPPSVRIVETSFVGPDRASNQPSSSFCRRRRGPALEKMSFATNQSLNMNVYSANDAYQDHQHRGSTATPGGAGVVLDLHVTASEPHSRRLGSDGVEDDSEEFSPERPSYSSELVIPVTSPFKLATTGQKSNSLPRCSVGYAEENRGKHGLLRRGNGLPLPQISCKSFTDPIDQDNTLLSYLLPPAVMRSSTAPSTPVVMRLERDEAFRSPVTLVQSDSDYPRDVEMMQEDGDTQHPSPPSPTMRFRSKTDPLLLSTCEKREQVSPSSSPRVDRFVSRKTRSPKILKKSFNLNLRPSYGYHPFRNTKLQTACSAFRPRTQESHLTAKTIQMSCESPNPDGISALSLSSPVTAKDDPLRHASELHGSTSPSRDSISNGVNVPSPRATNFCSRTCSSGNSHEPFRLVQAAELKPRWRTQKRVARTHDATSHPTSGEIGS
uniref:protein-tyrosine-phosphatase n=1 Tax=Ciona savignyi TaxID=51511 RepID=H2Z577_CIOSA